MGLILFYISAVILFTYVVYICIRFGVPESLSESFYLLGGRNKGGVIFYVTLVLSIFPLLIFWLDMSEETFQPLVFFSCSSLILVGAAGDFKDISTNRIHVIAAVSCAILSQLWIAIYSMYWISFLILLTIGLTIGTLTPGITKEGRTKNSIIFFVEMAAFINTYIAVLGYYLISN